MTGRRWLVLCVAALVIGLVTGFWLLWPRTAINAENFQRIQVGMTREEVDSVLGGPERDETTGPVVAAAADDEGDDAQVRVEIFAFSYDPSLMLTVRTPPQSWHSDNLVVRIEFDEHGRVAGKECMPVRRIHESLLAKFCRWLRL